MRPVVFRVWWMSQTHVLLGVQALDAGSAAALPDGLRAELEQLEDHGGVSHLHDLAAQIKVCTPHLKRYSHVSFCFRVCFWCCCVSMLIISGGWLQH